MQTRRAGLLDFLVTAVLAVGFVILVHVAFSRGWVHWPGAE